LEQATGDESGDEHFADMAEDDDNNDSGDTPAAPAALSATLDDDDGDEHFADAPDSEDESPKEPGDIGYDPLKREPMYTGAETTSFWELLQVHN
jgi:hypothetical protein